MEKRTYKNITENDLVVVGHGVVKSGETIKTETPIVSANFEEIEVKETKGNRR